MSLRLYLDPADNFMIRDGRPFNQDDAGRAAAVSRFPPPPDTLYGAARVALARALGWSGEGDWAEGDGGNERVRLLGTWRDEKNAGLRVSGPHFELSGVRLLPLPATVYLVAKTDGSASLQNLRPGPAIKTDCGDLRLLDLGASGKGLRNAALGGRWGFDSAVRRILAGEQTDAAALTPHLPGPAAYTPRAQGVNSGTPLPGISTEALGAPEARIGLERISDTRQAAEGKLYASTRRVLPPGVRMFVEVEGVEVPEGWFSAAVPLGGEGRFAFVEARRSAPVAMTSIPRGTYLVMLTTPALLPELTMGMTIEGLPGELAAAAVTGVTTTAQFERRGVGQREHTASVAVLPPGSVLFMTGSDGSPPKAAIGDRTWRGYGQFLTGVWNDG